MHRTPVVSGTWGASVDTNMTKHYRNPRSDSTTEASLSGRMASPAVQNEGCGTGSVVRVIRRDDQSNAAPEDDKEFDALVQWSLDCMGERMERRRKPKG